MEAPVLPKRVYRFGLFQVDPDGGKLLREGVPVKLQEQPLRVLCLLLERPGEIVTREELRQTLWAEGTYVEFDGSLNATLKRLRFALGDDADNPVFIETVPRRGYRFIAPVSATTNGHGSDEALADAAAAPANGNHVLVVDVAAPAGLRPAPQNLSAKRSKRGKILRHAAIGIAAAVLAWQVVYWAFPLPAPRIVRRVRLSSTGGVEAGPIAMGAGRVFFTVRRGGRYFPMQASLQGGEATEVETPFPLAYVFDISPDQSSLLLGAAETRMDESALWIWPLKGGVPRRFGNYTCGDARWSPDGRQIAFTSNGNLNLISPDGTGLQKIAHFGGSPFNLTWSPHGESLRFTTYDDLSRLHRLWEVHRDGSGLHEIDPLNDKNESLRDGVWLKNGEYFAFWSGSDTNMSLWLTRERPSFWRRSEKTPVQVASSGNDSIERAGGKCGYDSRLGAVTTWHDSKFMQILPRDQKFASVPISPAPYSVDFSPKGEWVAFASGKDGGVWRCGTDWRNCISLTGGKLGTDLIRWSPDGKQILFRGQAAEGPPRLHAVSADGFSQPRILSPMDKEASRADWSPDGKQIVVSLDSVTPGNENSIYILDVASGNLEFVPESKGLQDPIWSPDGKWIAARDLRQRKIFFYNTARKHWIPGPEGKIVAYLQWSRHSKDLFYQELGAPNQAIYRVEAGTAKARFYRDFSEILGPQAAGCRMAGIGPDDSLYFYTLENKSDLVLLDLDLP